MIKILRQTVFFQTSGYILQFLAFFIFARILGTEDQGILTIFRTLGQIFAAIMWIGLPASIAYFIGRDKGFFFSLITNCFKWFLLVFPLFALFIYLVPVNNILKFNLIKPYIAYLLIFVFSLSFFNLFQGVMLSLKKYLYYNLFAFILGLVIFSFSILIGLLPQICNKLTYAIIAYVIGYGFIFFYGFIVVFFEGRRLKNEPPKKITFFNQFNVGIRGFISNMAWMMLFRLDLFLVGYFLPLSRVGVYSVALFGAEMVTKIPIWSSSILKPMVASNEEGHARRTVYLFYSSIITGFILGLFVLLILVILPNFITNLIGKDFSGAEVCLLLLLPRVIMQSGVAALAANLAGKGYPLHHPAGSVIALLYLILLDIILIPRFGINGAAIANSLAFIACFIVYYLGFQKYNNESILYGLKPFISYLIGKL